MVKYIAEEAVHNRGCEAVGKTMLELMKNMDDKLTSKKSRVGDAWESWFYVEKNSVPGADLIEAGVELKATAVIDTKNGKSAKERLVLNIINFIEEFDKEFLTSSFWKKNKLMELGFYEYDKDKKWLDWKILRSVLFTYPEKDLMIIKQDWEKIHEYIRTGRAHELSEGLTMYLGACTKGANKNSLREQHSSLKAPKAMQRAYSLKSGYMTFLLREYIFGEKVDVNIRIMPFEVGEMFNDSTKKHSNESIVKDISILKNTTLEQYIISTLDPFKGRSVEELLKDFDIQNNDKKNYPKSIYAMISSRMLGIYGDLDRTEEFVKANVQVKTIRINKSGGIKESISFPAFKFKELANENWEDSILRDLLDSAKFFFVIFQEQEDGSYVFQNAKFWSMPEYELEDKVREAWHRTVDTINRGVELKFDSKRNVVKNNFVKKKDGLIIHVRPHASKASYMEKDSNADELPVIANWSNKPVKYSEKWMTKQCFWLNNDYVLDKLK